MDSARVHVREIKGRYPQEPRRLDSDNIEAQVEEMGQIVRIRIDDSSPGHEDMWLELTLEIGS